MAGIQYHSQRKGHSRLCFDGVLDELDVATKARKLLSQSTGQENDGRQACASVPRTTHR